MKKLWKNNRVVFVLVIILIICFVAICSVALTFFYSKDTNEYGNRLDGIEKHQISSEFKSSYKEKILESENVKSVDFNITAPETGDFSFLQSVEVYISAEGLNQVLLASKKNITNTGKTLSLDVDNKVDLKKYVTKNNIKLNLIVSTTKTTTAKYTIDTKLVFLVDANVMGL